MECPKCGGEMKVISFIEEPSVIRFTLKHLNLWEDPKPPPEPLEMVCEPNVDYVPWQDNVPGSPGNHKLLACWFPADILGDIETDMLFRDNSRNGLKSRFLL